MPTPQDLVFVVLDSVRKDRMSAFNHDRKTTPEFDELASMATLYENAFTPAPWTLPAHCSMFTGRFPSEHGITNGFTDRNLRLSSEFPTIPELLRERGYATGGFSNNPWVGRLSGLNRGFDRFVEWDLEITRSAGLYGSRIRDQAFSHLHTLLGRAAGQPHALLKRRFFTSNLVERAKKWVINTANRPSFTFMNVMEAHSPYYPPDEAFQELGLDPPGRLEARALNTKLLAYVLGKSDLSTTTRRRVMEFYDAGLRYQDRKLGELLSSLHSEGLFDDAMIVLCSDHGKTLGDIDRDATPPHYVRDINVNVPMAIKWPNQTSSERVSAPVELVELFEAIRDVGRTRSIRTRPDGALVEDYIPHTGRNVADVVRWRVLADRKTKYVHHEGGGEYLFNRATTETAVDGTAAEFEPHRERLHDRVRGLDVPSDRNNAEATAENIGGSLEDQLKDLGYLS